MRTLTLASTLIALIVGLETVAADWPQFLGPDRNGVYRGPELSETWGEGGPPVVWRQQVGQGLSGPVVVDGRIILFHRVSDREVVEAFDRKTGKSLWQYGYPTTYRDDFGWDEGPRSVPVVVDGVVYTFGAQGQLHAVELETGEPVWSVDTMRRFRVPKGFFGAASSPLVEDGRVIANIGGRDAGIIAFDAKDGEVLWTSTRDGASYSSPVRATIAERSYAIFFTRNGLVGLDPETGKVAFEKRWRSRSASSINAASPVVIDDSIFISMEYGPGAGVLGWDGDRLTELWSSNDALSNHYATSVYRDGFLYGYHGRQEFGPSLRAVEFQTGEVQWSVDRFGAGSIVLAGDHLVVVRERGELVLVDASPEEFTPIVWAQILPGTVRAYPALSDGFLYVRNDDTLVALDLRR